MSTLAKPSQTKTAEAIRKRRKTQREKPVSVPNLTQLMNYSAPVAIMPNKTQLKRELLAYAGVTSVGQFKKEDPMFKYWSAENIYNHLSERKASDELTALYKRNQEIAERRELAKSNAAMFRYAYQTGDIVHLTGTALERLTSVYNALQQFAGKLALITYVTGSGVSVLNSVEQIPALGPPFSRWFRESWHTLVMQNSENTIMEADDYAGVLTIAAEHTPTFTEYKPQSFLDSHDKVSHCLLTPILNWATATGESAKSNCAKKRYNTIIKKTNAYINQYCTGIPESALAQVANDLQLDIVVNIPFSSTPIIEARSEKKRLKLFKFLNTRIDHVDLGKTTCESVTHELTGMELHEMRCQLDANKTHYTYERAHRGIASITTIDGVYRTGSDYNEVVKEFEKKYGLSDIRICAVKQQELTQFIKAGCNYNGCVDLMNLDDFVERKGGVEEFAYCMKNEKDKTLHHIDMRKAYTAFKKSKYYEGFLGKITDWRQCDKIMGVGMYQIRNIKFVPGKLRDINDRMQMYLGDNVYTSPELAMLTTNGCTFDIVAGCWGVAPLHFEFDEEMLQKGGDRVPFYSKWTGMCGRITPVRRVWMNGSKEYFETIRSQVTEGSLVTYGDKSGCLVVQKQQVYHKMHITAFVTAYQRLNLIEQLEHVDLNQIVRICTDGIYHLQEDVVLKNVFQVKEDEDDMTFRNKASERFLSAVCDESNDADISYIPPAREHFTTELHLGPGGCGKTQMQLTDAGLVRTLFVAPSWKLARNKRTELGVDATVWARVLSSDPEKTAIIRSIANVLIVDEVSMMTNDQKELLFERYPNMKIICCGDVGYQLPAVEGTPFKCTGFDNTVTHTKNYRCNDANLLEILNELREMIRDETPMAVINATVRRFMENKNRIINMDQLKEMYQLDDMILAGTNSTKDYYTDTFKGKFEQEKYYVTETSTNVANGDIRIWSAVPEHVKAEPRHCFTVHSIQGETAYNKLFIDTSRMFDPCMYYTALSRAKCLDQIYLVVNDMPVFKCPHAKIYKIKKGNDVYIGSTMYPLEKRFAEHLAGYHAWIKAGKTGKRCMSVELFDGELPKISLVEKYPCNSKADLELREKEIIQTTKCINKTYNEEPKITDANMTCA